MFTIELTLKHTALPLNVQKKSQEEADSTYAMLVERIQGNGDGYVELTCEQQPHKRVSVLCSEIAAVQIFEKSGTATASGRPPGFFALAEEG